MGWIVTFQRTGFKDVKVRIPSKIGTIKFNTAKAVKKRLALERQNVPRLRKILKGFRLKSIKKIRVGKKTVKRKKRKASKIRKR